MFVQRRDSQRNSCRQQWKIGGRTKKFSESGGEQFEEHPKERRDSRIEDNRLEGLPAQPEPTEPRQEGKKEAQEKRKGASPDMGINLRGRSSNHTRSLCVRENTAKKGRSTHGT